MDISGFFTNLSTSAENVASKIKSENASNVSKINSADEFVELCSKLGTYYSERLWHQLTQALLTLIRMPEAQLMGDEFFYQLYDKAISEFENKINPLSLVQLIIPAVERMKSDDETYKFIESIQEKVKQDKEAYAYARVNYMKFFIKWKGDPSKTKLMLEEVGDILDELENVGMVHREYYKLSSEFYCLQADHTEYYHSCLRYLGCADLDDKVSQDEFKSMSVMLSLAALLGKNIFNFGELLCHKILNHLKNTPNEWLIELLTAFNNGDVQAFNKLKSSWTKLPDLAVNEEVLYEKICLLALMNMTFERSSTDRQISFSDISKRTGLSEDKVELLTMKAQSYGLIKGEIDQVNEFIFVSWVLPRVLNKQQLATLMTKVDEWSKSISLMETLIQNNASDILTA